MISAFGVDHDLSKAERAPIKGVRGNTLVPPRPEKYGSTPWKRRATRRGKTPPPVLARLRQSENPRIARRAENIQFDYGTRQRPGAGNYPRRTRDTTPTKLAARKVGVMQSRMLAGEKYSMPKLATKLTHFRKSAFGVEHGEIEKGLPRALRRLPGKGYGPAIDEKPYDDLNLAGQAVQHRIAAHAYGKNMTRAVARNPRPGLDQSIVNEGQNQRAMSRRRMIQINNKKKPRRTLP